MPTSIEPPLADDELECARCGARFYFELTRCPNCGVNLYEPEENPDPTEKKQSRSPNHPRTRLGARLEGWVQRITKKPYPVDTLFGAALNQAELFDNLLAKAGGDHAVVERLIAYERQQAPQANRLVWIKRAIHRWEKDNQAPGSMG